jgi:hypothetical protein
MSATVLVAGYEECDVRLAASVMAQANPAT